MTSEEAYIDGFCKVAEAAGVDPEQLMKSAMPLRAVLMGMNKGRAGLQRALKALSNVGMRSKKEHKILKRLGRADISRESGITPGTELGAPKGPRVYTSNSLERANDQFRAYGDYVNKNPSVFDTLKGSPYRVSETISALAAQGADIKPHNIGNWMNPRMVYDRLFR